MIDLTQTMGVRIMQILFQVKEASHVERPPHSALCIVLRIFSALVAIGGLLMIFSNRPLIIRFFLHPPESEISTLLLFFLKETGGFMIMLSLMLFLASRDPERNVAIIDAVTAGLCILALTPILSLLTLEVRQLYPSYMIWGRSLIRLMLAALFFYLRPREILERQT